MLMNKSLCSLIVGLVLMCCCGLVFAQKSYTINSINSNIYVNSASCSVSVVETYEYDFLGSYSTVARAIPYSIAPISSFQTSSLKVDMLTPGYTASKYTSDQQDSKFIVVNMNPSTPAGTSTRITIRYSYALTGPIRQSGGNNLVTYYYMESSQIGTMNVTFTFDPTIDLKGSLSPSAGGVVNGNSVTFQKNYVQPNTAVQPSVSFNTISGQFSKCTNSTFDIGTIIIVVVVVAICICLSIICSIIGFFRRAVSNALGFQRWGGGSSSYGYVSNDYGHHHHYHSGGSHHHSGGGSSSRGGMTGTSGFAN